MSIIPAGISSQTSLALLNVQRNSPKLLLAGGIAGVVGTVVLASRATLKLNDVLDEANTKLEEVRELRANPETTPEEQKQLKKAQVVFTLEAAVNITKLYGPAALVGLASITALVSSHNILSKRNVALTAAYSALDKAYKAYRARVVEELGVEKDLDFAYGVQKVKTVQTDETTGKKKTVETRQITDISPYGRLYRVDNPNHTSLPDGNVSFLRQQEMYANDRLQRKGYVTLNSVYKSLGLEESSAGQVVGWTKNGNDGYISFGVFDKENSHKVVDLMMDSENEIWLDFNVDGVIYDKIDDILAGEKL